MNNVIAFNAPAAEWEEALPLGNGRLGAMVFDVPDREKIQLNEDSIWSGQHRIRTGFREADYMATCAASLNRAAALSWQQLLVGGDFSPHYARVYVSPLISLRISFASIFSISPWRGTVAFFPITLCW